MTKVKDFVYGQIRWRRSYETSFPDISHGKQKMILLSFEGEKTVDF